MKFCIYGKALGSQTDVGLKYDALFLVLKDALAYCVPGSQQPVTSPAAGSSAKVQTKFICRWVVLV
jgi:hypothetical protein